MLESSTVYAETPFLHVLFHTTLKRAGISASAFPKLTSTLASVTKAIEDKAKQSLNPTASKDKSAEISTPAQQFPPIPPVTPSTLDTNSIDWSATGLVSSLKIIFDAAVLAAFPELAAHPHLNLHKAVITRCSNPKNGDFQCNNAMALAKAIKTEKDIFAQYAGALPFDFSYCLQQFFCSS